MNKNSSQTMLSEYNDILHVSDIQQILGISRQKVYSLIDAGTIWAIRPGKNFLIPKNSLINYIEGESRSP